MVAQCHSSVPFKAPFQVVQLMGLVVQKLGLSIRAISDKIAAEASHRVLKFLKWNHDRPGGGE